MIITRIASGAIIVALILFLLTESRWFLAAAVCAAIINLIFAPTHTERP